MGAWSLETLLSYKTGWLSREVVRMVREVVLKGSASSFVAAVRNQCFSLEADLESGLLFPIGVDESRVLAHVAEQWGEQVECGRFLTKGQCRVASVRLEEEWLFSQQSLAVRFKRARTMDQLKQAAEALAQRLGVLQVICKDGQGCYLLLSMGQSGGAVQFA